MITYEGYYDTKQFFRNERIQVQHCAKDKKEWVCIITTSKAKSLDEKELG